MWFIVECFQKQHPVRDQGKQDWVEGAWNCGAVIKRVSANFMVSSPVRMSLQSCPELRHACQEFCTSCFRVTWRSLA